MWQALDESLARARQAAGGEAGGEVMGPLYEARMAYQALLDARAGESGRRRSAEAGRRAVSTSRGTEFWRLKGPVTSEGGGGQIFIVNLLKRLAAPLASHTERLPYACCAETSEGSWVGHYVVCNCWAASDPSLLWMVTYLVTVRRRSTAPIVVLSGCEGAWPRLGTWIGSESADIGVGETCHGPSKRRHILCHEYTGVQAHG